MGKLAGKVARHSGVSHSHSSGFFSRGALLWYLNPLLPTTINTHSCTLPHLQHQTQLWLPMHSTAANPGLVIFVLCLDIQSHILPQLVAATPSFHYVHAMLQQPFVHSSPIGEQPSLRLHNSHPCIFPYPAPVT